MYVGTYKGYHIQQNIFSIPYWQNNQLFNYQYVHTQQVYTLQEY